MTPASPVASIAGSPHKDCAQLTMTMSVLGHMPQYDMSEATAWSGAVDMEIKPPSGSNAISMAAKIATIETLRRDLNKLMQGLSRVAQALASARYALAEPEFMPSL